jgi:hypothetical protein
MKQALRHVMKYKVSDDVIGTPSWHRKMFNDLLAMVNHFGMPDLFLTLTSADKAPHGLKWEEVRECMMGWFQTGGQRANEGCHQPGF